MTNIRPVPGLPLVDAVNRRGAQAMLETGETIPIVTFSIGGELFEADDADEALRDVADEAIAGPDKAGFWHRIDLTQFDARVLN